MPEIMKGLKDVYFDNTEASFIDGDVGKLLYRGYSIHDLAEKSTFEEVVYLLLYGELPSQSELTDFDAKLRANRRIPDLSNDWINTMGNPTEPYSAGTPDVPTMIFWGIIALMLILGMWAPAPEGAYDKK